MPQYYVYILASKKFGTLYIGVTSDLIKRVSQHRQGVVEGFTKRHDVHNLVYFETTSDIQTALEREKQLKAWKRIWKIRLIQEANPDWDDQYASLI